MKKTFLWAAVPVALCFGCGATFPVPTQAMADAESAHRSALEVGAASQPTAELHVKLAEDQMAKAKTLISNGDNREAGSLLVRSKADSELALVLAREQGARTATQTAMDKASSTSITNAAEGAVK